MSDLIKKSEVIEAVERIHFTVIGLRSGKGVLAEFAKRFMEAVIDTIKEQPTVDAVEVVHCKDCAKWGCGLPMETDSVKCCGVGGYMVDGNGYCVYGELWSRKKV